MTTVLRVPPAPVPPCPEETGWPASPTYLIALRLELA